MLSKSINNTKQVVGHPLEIRIYGSESGVFDLYEDDGLSFDYQKDVYQIRKITIKNGNVSQHIDKKGPSLFGPITNTRVMTKP